MNESSVLFHLKLFKPNRFNVNVDSMEKRQLRLEEVSSGLARQSESLIHISDSLRKINKLVESNKASGAIGELSREMDMSEEAIQELIAEGIVRKVWDELNHSANSVVELGVELKGIVELLAEAKKSSLVKGLL